MNKEILNYDKLLALTITDSVMIVLYKKYLYVLMMVECMHYYKGITLAIHKTMF